MYSKRGVALLGVVPVLDEVENRQAGLRRVAESLPIKQFALERDEEALAQSVVMHRPRGPSTGGCRSLGTGSRRPATCTGSPRTRAPLTCDARDDARSGHSRGNGEVVSMELLTDALDQDLAPDPFRVMRRGDPPLTDVEQVSLAYEAQRFFKQNYSFIYGRASTALGRVL